MIRTIVDADLNIHHRTPGHTAVLHGLDHPGLDSGNIFLPDPSPSRVCPIPLRHAAGTTRSMNEPHRLRRSTGGLDDGRYPSRRSASGRHVSCPGQLRPQRRPTAGGPADPRADPERGGGTGLPPERGGPRPPGWPAATPLACCCPTAPTPSSPSLPPLPRWLPTTRAIRSWWATRQRIRTGRSPTCMPSPTARSRGSSRSPAD